MGHLLFLVTVTFIVALAIWLTLEIVLRTYVGWRLPTDFYGSIPRGETAARQARHGIRVAHGAGWAHLGWIADPDAERYRVEQRAGDDWQTVGRVQFGSCLLRESGAYRVWAEPADGSPERLLGEVHADVGAAVPPPSIPRIDGPWRILFRPTAAGDYVNDHTVYRDARGAWRLAGITAKGDGNYAAERAFAVGVSADFPPADGMKECPPVADFGALAWAPHVIDEAGTYYMFWSPHQLHRTRSADGITWDDHRIVIRAPVHKFFRDAMILKVADGQWLLYATGRGRYFSRVDVYQSFDLEGWQYIGGALATGRGSERNSLVASTESPSVVRYRERYYLAVTYNNDSFFWSVILLALKMWRDPRSYNETLIFHADNPYDFGVYRGRRDAPTLLTRLAAHAAEILYQPEQDRWYITTAGWPWVATLTAGEVAIAPLRWDPIAPPARDTTAGAAVAG